MEEPEPDTEDDYPELAKLFGRRIFVSEPVKYLLVLSVFQLSMLIYFLVTINRANLPLKIVTIAFYIIETLIVLSFPFVDPGIVPKIATKRSEADKIPLDINQMKKGRDGFIYKQYNMGIKSHVLWVKYCGSCTIYRPPRTVHCYTCEVCIERLDHHCPWLGGCIGKRNYYVYLLYIIFMEAIIGLLLYQTSSFIVEEKFQQGRVDYVFNAILLALCIPASIFVLILIVLHLKLSKENLTTNELWHNKWETSSGNPFQKTFFIKNWMKIFQSCYTSKYDMMEQIEAERSGKIENTCNMETINFAQIKVGVPSSSASKRGRSLHSFDGLEIVLKTFERPNG